MQSRLADCARANLRSVPEGVDAYVLESDWNNISVNDIPCPVNYIVSNPPYRRIGSGRINPGSEEAMARHEVAGSASTVLKTSSRLLSKGGGISIIYPAVRMAGLFRDMASHRFEPKRIRMIHSRRGEVARLFMVEARFGGGEELTVLPPLYVYETGKKYTTEAASILSGDRFGVRENPTTPA